MKHINKKWMTAMAMSVLAMTELALGGCGKEESENSSAQSAPNITMNENSGTQGSSSAMAAQGSDAEIHVKIDTETDVKADAKINVETTAETYDKGNDIAYENSDSESGEDSAMNDGLKERIKKVEEYCNVKFPEDYILFIEEYNAGQPAANTFRANKTDYTIDRFLGFISDYQNSPLGEYDIAVVMAPIETYLTDNPDLVGAELVPIAVLSTGDYVCLDFKDNKEEPSVCVWDSTKSEEFHPVTYKAADFFLQFAENLE
ncbi:MAG: SMI1/KNR4 family protein [Bacteroidales bacterium]|nr:SMI1/KNR4 family protein [Lachnoclostridium sp.]MCM1384155.1 SMI1/KNR4 family protein [Lachnoclostridium sp.]MCM1464821.1 SMI1/KNR4 family protein [Bacteroidales bacterium]